jgi:hypothetical protein
MGYTDQLHTGKLDKRLTEAENKIDNMIKSIELLNELLQKKQLFTKLEQTKCK